MYDAYTVIPVAQKLPLEIQSIATHSGAVLAGTKNGFLLVYKPSKDSGSRNYDVQMCRNFSKKAVTQLEIVSKLQIMICLTDNMVFVHDIMQVNYPVMGTMLKTRGASMFALHLTEDDTLYLCVVVRRRLQLYRWAQRDFEEMQTTDFSFPDSIRTVAWCGSYIGVAVRDEYFLLTVFSRNMEDPVGNVKPLFTTGNRSIEPLIVPLPDRQIVGFCRDESVLFVKFDGEISREYPEMPWSEVPQAIAYDSPYLVAVLSRQVEVRSIKPCICIQSIDTHRPRFICRGLRLVFVAGLSDVLFLSAAPNLKQNIQMLVKDKLYDLAIQLAEKLTAEDTSQKQKRIQAIRYLYAFHLYCQCRFSEAFEIYRKIEPEVLYVIGLFPDLLPEEVRKGFVYPDRLLTDFPLEDLKRGLQALTEYLSEIRTKLAYQLSIQSRLKDRQSREVSDGDKMTAEEKELTLSEEQLAQNQNLLRIVDTTLLKCYLEIFTEDCEEVRELDRNLVLRFLLQEGQSVVIPYLEHIIFQWDEDRSVFHDALAEQYVTKVKLLMTDFLQSLPEGHDVPPAGKEPGDLGLYRHRLLYFLEYSMSYSPELLLVQIPHDALYEERALLLGRLKRHEQAIAIYTNILLDYKAAEHYCNSHYSRGKKEDSDVYLLLLRMYAQPPDNSILGLMHSTLPKPRPNVAQALRVLKDYAACIDTVKGTELLAGDIKLDQLWAALEAVLQQTANRQRSVEVDRGLFYATQVREQGRKMKAEGVKLVVGYDSGCIHCGKKISNRYVWTEGKFGQPKPEMNNFNRRMRGLRPLTRPLT